jgi:hypothetical protein
MSDSVQITVGVSVVSYALVCLDISALLGGTVPDEGWNMGDLYSRGGKSKTYKFSRWTVVERGADVIEGERLVNRLIARLKPLQSLFRALPSEMDVSFQVSLTESNDVFGFGLDRNQVEFIASIRAEIDMSFVIRPVPFPPIVVDA